MITRLGLQCQTPALSKVYFTWVGTIILGLKKFLVPKKFRSTQKNFGPKNFWSVKNLGLRKFLVPKKS